MSVDESDAAHDEYMNNLYNLFGPDWALEHHEELYKQHSEEAIREFTAERLKSYYIAHPSLATPALDALRYAGSLLAPHPKAALVFAVTANELAVKSVLLKPIVFGLVHIEGLAGFITDLSTQHTGMERFQTLLTEILARFGGVDLKTYRRGNSATTLWKEMDEAQRFRNALIHRNEAVPDSAAGLAFSVASTLLQQIFPLVLAKLDLHLHDPGVVCGKRHSVGLVVYFRIFGSAPTIHATVEVAAETMDLENPPERIKGYLVAGYSDDDLASLQSAGSVEMWITSTLHQYAVCFTPTSREFSGTLANTALAKDQGQG